MSVVFVLTNVIPCFVVAISQQWQYVLKDSLYDWCAVSTTKLPSSDKVIQWKYFGLPWRSGSVNSTEQYSSSSILRTAPLYRSPLEEGPATLQRKRVRENGETKHCLTGIVQWGNQVEWGDWPAEHCLNNRAFSWEIKNVTVNVTTERIKNLKLTKVLFI